MNICDETSQLRLISGPASEPVTLSEAKLFLRIDHTADDTLVSQAIIAARLAAEEHMRIALLPQTFEYSIGKQTQIVPLPVGPAQSITQIQTYDQAGTATVIGSATYRLSVDGWGLVFTALPAGQKWVITYMANLAMDAASVPALIKQGILHHIAVMLEQRQGLVPMPAFSLDCYRTYRRVRL